MPTKRRPVLHILESQQFNRHWLLEQFFPEVARMKRLVEVKGVSSVLSDKTVCLLFYEPSTRTRVSFEQAAQKLGAKIASTENAKQFSSAIKGESLVDTIRVANALKFDAIVLRSDYEGAASDAASVSQIPIINAGDGAGQHPTQALLDVYTIFEHFKHLDNLKIALVGDLKNGRTTRSLAYLLGKFKKIHFELVAPAAFQMKQDILDYFDRHGVSYRKAKSLKDTASEVDVVYLTRLQKERLKKNSKINGDGVRLNEKIMSLLNKKSIILHPLPRSDGFDELPERFTDDPRVVIFKQVENGLYTRMALLTLVLSK